jgi:hypothetical protein
MLRRTALLFPIAIAIASPAAAQSARDILMDAAYSVPDKATALARIDRALKAADAVLARDPRNLQARLSRAMAISYRSKLGKSRSDAMTSRREFEALVAAHPNDAEAQMALAGWHLGAVIELGPLMARTALGARKGTGLQALKRALALGGDRAMFPAFASLNQIQIDPGNIAEAKRLAEAAVRARAPTQLDRIMQRQAAILLRSLNAGNGQAAARAAKTLSPFGRVR